MIVRPEINDGGLVRLLAPGDVPVTGELFPAAVTTTATTITGAILAQGWYNRNLSANGTDTVDSAANIIAALSQGLNTIGLENNMSFRFSIYNSAAFTDTVTATANTGVTVNAGVVNNASVKDFIVTINNGTPAVTVTGTSTNASAVITGLTDTQVANVTVGMVVTNAVAGLQGTTVRAVNRTNNSITLSGNASASGAVSINLSPVITIQGIGQKLV